ncbi:stage VI sporulation protein F [Marinicrinis lubricantis]|uniref:Stage VI sporulation protein F n=1 Tax=Marinicrinis lubricantis TaxID=2086470 RepID=A0ABW1IST6_9BACL
MVDKNLPKDVLNTVNKKTGKNVSPSDIHKIASGVKPSTIQSEKQLRQLINQVSNLVNIPVSEATVNEIVKAVKKSGANPNNMEQLMKMMMGKK